VPEGRAAFGLTYIGPCLGPARRAEVAAQALNGRRAGPALSTIDRASGRVRAVLFRAVPRAANRARPIWNSIGKSESSKEYHDTIFHKEKTSLLQKKNESILICKHISVCDIFQE
jgi:hypothetical protein